MPSVLHAVEAGNDPVAEAGCGVTVAPQDARAVANGLLKMQLAPAARGDGAARPRIRAGAAYVSGVGEAVFGRAREDDRLTRRTQPQASKPWLAEAARCAASSRASTGAAPSCMAWLA